jgi:hypothetical protein
MIDITRVAFVACGTLRNFKECHHTWNIFKEQDNYVFTWDTDYVKTCNRDSYQLPTVTKIENLIEATKQNKILDYYVFNESFTQVTKSPYLWSILDDYISYDYDYIFITRPDIWINQNNYSVCKENYKPPKDNEIQLMHVDHINRMTSDEMLFMKMTTYKKFSKIFSFIKDCDDIGSIHHLLYKFFSFEGIKISDHLKFCIHPILYRTQSLINKNTIYQVREEDIRCRDKFNQGMERQNSIKNSNIKTIGIVLVSSTILSPERKKLYSELAVEKYSKSHNHKNYCWRFFEAATPELGVEKINTYKKLYDIDISDIDIMDCNV